MSLLRIHLPPDWLDTDAAAPLPWCRIGTRGERIDAGRAPLAGLPAADACELVIPSALVLLTAAVLPRGSRHKLRQLLPYAIEDRLGGDPETVHVAAGHAAGDGRTALAALDRDWLARVLARLRERGLRPRSAWPETLLPPLPAGGWVMVWTGHGGFLRTAAQGGLHLDGDGTEMPPPALRLSVAQAQAAGNPPQRLEVRLEEGAAAPAWEAWRDVLGIPVAAGAPWAPLQQPEIAAGAINLLQGAFAASDLRRTGWPNLRLPLGLAALIVLLQAGATTAEWALLSREKRDLQATMERSFREAFPDARVVVDAPLQMQRNLAELRRAGGETSPSDFVPLLARAAAALDADTRGRLREIHFAADQLRLGLELQDRTAADALLQRLTAAGLSGRLQAANGPTPQPLTQIVITGGTS
jgi:general secretion pathway protein L